MKRVHLEKNHPELGEISAQTESLWATGHRVGEISQRLYGSPDSVEIAFDKRLGIMLNKTRHLIEGGANFPIFEATFRHEGVLVRVDVLVPDADGWRIIEIKASTSVKEYHVLDCAIQDWVLRNAGINVTAVSLAHINNRFVYPGNGDYDGLLVEHDLTDEVRMLELGRQDDEWAEVLGGLEPGTRYVTTNSYVLKADVEKSGATHDH